jgi:hypothetical protein
LTAAVVIGAMFLLGMAAAAGYGMRVLPDGARVPLNAGVPEYSVWLPERAGLAAWMGVGAVAFAMFAALTLSRIADGWSPSVRVVLLPCVMLVILAGEPALSSRPASAARTFSHPLTPRRTRPPRPPESPESNLSPCSPSPPRCPWTMSC